MTTCNPVIHVVLEHRPTPAEAQQLIAAIRQLRGVAHVHTFPALPTASSAPIDARSIRDDGLCEFEI
jgi:hypothetical protein